MTKPAWKTNAMNEMLENFFQNNRIENIKADICVSCGEPATEFSDEVSRREFSISGLCQKCQDIAFAIPEDEE